MKAYTDSGKHARQLRYPGTMVSPIPFGVPGVGCTRLTKSQYAVRYHTGFCAQPLAVQCLLACKLRGCCMYIACVLYTNSSALQVGNQSADAWQRS